MRRLPFIFVATAGCLWFASAHEAAAPRPRRELQFGTPSDDFVAREGFLCGVARHRTGWTLEYRTATHFSGKASRSGYHFLVDDSQPAEFRWSPADYEGSGFDIGHFVPANDCTYSARAMLASFSITQAMPQTPALNRGPLRSLESHIEKLASRSGVEAWIVTLEIYLPNEDGEIRYQRLGERDIPTHVGKAVLCLKAGKFEAHGWLLPNNERPPRFEKCPASIDELEQASGFDLFPGLPDETEDALEARR